MVRNAFGRRFVAKCFRITEPDASAFKLEARALEALRHPNVVHLYDTVSDGVTVFKSLSDFPVGHEDVSLLKEIEMWRRSS
jgi:hypothetical protein